MLSNRFFRCPQSTLLVRLCIAVLLGWTVFVPAFAQEEIKDGPVTTSTGATGVTFHEHEKYAGNFLVLMPDDDAQSLNVGGSLNLTDRVSSIEIPLGFKVTLIDGASASTGRRTVLYPGNYPRIFSFQDRTNFVIVERIPEDTPVAYFFDELEDVGSSFPYRSFFHGVGLEEGLNAQDLDVDQLLGNDRFEMVLTYGLLDVTVYRDGNFGGAAQGPFYDNDGTGRPHRFGNDLFDNVSSLRVRRRTNVSEASLTASQVSTGSDYYATIGFVGTPSSDILCNCAGVNNQVLNVISDGFPIALPATGQGGSVWNSSISVELEPGTTDKEVELIYNSGELAGDCFTQCGYALDRMPLKISTAPMKAPILDSFSVLDGGRIQLHWSLASDVPPILVEAHITRSGQRIATVDLTDFSYITSDFPQSSAYDYTIEVEAFDQTATSNALKIYPPIGILAGNVSTRPGGLNGVVTGVRNVRVCATQETELEGVPAGTVYCDTSDVEGNYRIENIYFGAESEFRVEPFREGHGFEPALRSRILTPQISVERMINFTDTTSFVVAGRVVQPGYPNDHCAVGNAEILINGMFLGDKTDPDGNFVVSVPQAGLFSIKPRLAEHSFDPPEYMLLVEEDTTGLLFMDTTTQLVSGFVRAGCERFIGQAEVRFLSPDNCYDTTMTTSLDSGYFEIRLPARRYDVSVLGFDSLVVEDLDEGEVVGFLQDKPIDLTEADTTIDFTYRLLPVLQIRGLPDPLCADIPFPILNQLDVIQLEIEVFEGEDGCPVDTGTLFIVDRISFPVREESIPISRGRARYSFEATEPNILPPDYTKMLSMRADVDGRITEEQIDVIVVGVKAREKTFATVTPELPLLILRDPPGDASSSFLQQNAIFQAATSFSTLQNESGKVWTNVKAGTKFQVGFGYTTEVKVWGDFGASASFSATTKDNEEFITSFKTSEKFSTSNSELVTGPSGDVFVGAALNMIYALADEINVEFDGGACRIVQDTTLIMGNDGFATTYIYTERHVRNTLIPQLIQLSALNRVSNPDTAAFFDNQISVWQQTLDRNEELKNKAKFVENRSFSANAPYESSTTSSSTDKMTIEYTDVIDAGIALSAGLEIAGVGFSGGASVNFRMETGASRSQQTTEELTTGFVLNDGDPGDFFSVDIKTDPVYNTPVFELISGRSSCPFEPGTQPRQAAQIDAVELVQTDVDPEKEAVFRLRLGNASQSDEGGAYVLKFNQASNPDGATIRVGGSEYQGPVSYVIPAGSTREATVTVERGPLAYSYPDLQFLLQSPCDTSITASISLSAFFQSDCSPISIQTDEPEWIVNLEDEGQQFVRLTDYDKDNLERVTIEYTALGSGEWDRLRILEPGDLSDLPGGTNASLDLSALSDGFYQIRARLECQQGFVYSESLSGRIDREAPRIFGQPLPADDEYAPGEELSVTFNEPIACLFVTDSQIKLIRLSDSTSIPVNVGCAEDKLLFQSAQDLSSLNGEAFAIVVDGIQDLSGNQIENPISWSFAVGPESAEIDPDIDGDGIVDVRDNCFLAFNVEQRDLDGDGIGDACDDDIDGDGVPNGADNAPYYINPDQLDTDGDGIGDAAEQSADGDQDGIANMVDNCPRDGNGDQLDTDGDGIGDACDDDIDNDGITNSFDNCPTLPNTLQEDADSNGVGNVCEGIVSFVETLTLRELNIYPNPTTDFLNIDIEPMDAGDHLIELHSPLGQKMVSRSLTLPSHLTRISMDLDDLSGGIYLLTISSQGKSIGKRLIVH